MWCEWTARRTRHTRQRRSRPALRKLRLAPIQELPEQAVEHQVAHLLPVAFTHWPERVDPDQPQGLKPLAVALARYPVAAEPGQAGEAQLRWVDLAQHRPPHLLQDHQTAV